jgi:hypothetical protein
MTTLRPVLLGVSIAAATLLSVAPTFALDGCGFNGHRSPWGHCEWGGQNQHYCLNRTGHPATYLGHGVWHCYRYPNYRYQ